jgi:hypothetical protein
LFVATITLAREEALVVAGGKAPEEGEMGEDREGGQK